VKKLTPHLAQPAKDGVLPAYCRNTSRESSKSVLILSEMDEQFLSVRRVAGSSRFW